MLSCGDLAREASSSTRPVRYRYRLAGQGRQCAGLTCAGWGWADLGWRKINNHTAAFILTQSNMYYGVVSV
jgi:hypothetical protein